MAEKVNNSYVFNTEIMLDGSTLTNKLIEYFLIKDCSRVAYKFIFEKNDEYTRNTFKSSIINIVETYVASRCISEYRVICDEKNNDNPVTLVCDIMYKPQHLAEFITVRVSANSY